MTLPILGLLIITVIVITLVLATMKANAATPEEAGQYDIYNAASVGIINGIYQVLVNFFVKWENNKYE